jgi:hypothetical protein
VATKTAFTLATASACAWSGCALTHWLEGAQKQPKRSIKAAR